MTAAYGALIGGALVLFTVCFVVAINNAAQWVSDQADKKAAAREAASSFCAAYIPQVEDVAAIDAGLPKMGELR